jgi:hypothetical protein
LEVFKWINEFGKMKSGPLGRSGDFSPQAMASGTGSLGYMPGRKADWALGGRPNPASKLVWPRELLTVTAHRAATVAQQPSACRTTKCGGSDG